MTRCASSTPACRGAWVSRGCSRSPARRTRGSSTPRCSRPWPGLPSRRPSSRPICVCCSTKAGGDRQRLHEVIRTHSLAVAQAVAGQGAPNDLLERLARDPAFKALKIAVRPEELEPAAYVGRAPRQVDEFLEHVLPAVLQRVEAVAPAAAAAEVTV